MKFGVKRAYSSKNGAILRSFVMIDPTKARLCLLRVPWHGRGWVRLSLVMLGMVIAKNDSCLAYGFQFGKKKTLFPDIL